MSVTKQKSGDFGYYHDDWDVAIIPSGPGFRWVDFGSGGTLVSEEAFDALRECFRAYEKDRPADANEDEVSEKMCHALAAYIRDKEDYVQEREES